MLVRTKQAVSDKVPFSTWITLYPSPRVSFQEREHQPHSPSTVPPTADFKPWDDFGANVVPSLVGFYTGTRQSGIAIPRGDQYEMLKYLNEGPSMVPNPQPPAWGDWQELPRDDVTPTSGGEVKGDGEGEGVCVFVCVCVCVCVCVRPPPLSLSFTHTQKHPHTHTHGQSVTHSLTHSN